LIAVVGWLFIVLVAIVVLAVIGGASLLRGRR
jgi:hypothetical protein